MKNFDVRNMLVPTDLGETSVRAMKYARIFADRIAASVTFLYVDPITYPVDYFGATAPLLVSSSPEHEAQLRSEVEKFVEAPFTGRPYLIEISTGLPVPTIVRAAEEKHADLIVVGTHGRRGWRRALLGSVAEGVLHGSSCPVLCVSSAETKADAEPVIRRVVCPVNFTDVALDSLRTATRVAELFHAELLVVHVVEAGEASDPAEDEAKVRLWIEPELQQSSIYRQIVTRGGAAERVLDCVEDLRGDLLVLGAQHRVFRDTTVVGTTTERLIRFAPCPVLVVPRLAVEQQAKEAKEDLAAV